MVLIYRLLGCLFMLLAVCFDKDIGFTLAFICIAAADIMCRIDEKVNK